MKTPFGSPWFVAVGASAVVFIGAFAHFDPAAPRVSGNPPPTPPVAEQPVAPDPPARSVLSLESSPPMAEIIRLAESRVDPDVILAYIQNSGQNYSPTADEILYLSHIGVPQNVIAALYTAKSEHPPAITPVLTTAEPPPIPAPLADASSLPPTVADVGSNAFADALTPYGNWVRLPDYGDAWQPSVETTNPDWRPYVDDGQWVASDSGWSWQSEYPWGWAPFHYGGWINAPPLGWVWVPGKTWGPGWVAWRSAAPYIGWAPLPPGVSLNVLAQLTFSGHPVAPDFDFGLSLSSFSFVRVSRFLNPDLPRHVVPAGRSAALAASSTALNNYSVVNNKVSNGGPARNLVAAAQKQRAPEVPREPAPPPLMASARGQETELPSIRLPPLRGPPLPFDNASREPAQGYPTGPGQRTYFGGGPAQSPPRLDQRPAPEENHTAAASPARNSSAASSNGKSTK